MAGYRTIGNGFNSVDESLFGNTSRKNSASRTARRIEPGSAPPVPQRIVISHSELERIKKEASIKTDTELDSERSMARSALSARNRTADERKEKMRELERKALLTAKKSDAEAMQLGRDDALRERNSDKSDSTSDVVKLLTSMSMRATAFTIRDKQLEEKKQREMVEDDYERRMDILMELDRVKDLKGRQEEEISRQSRRKLDISVINEQIDERHRAKLSDQEAKEQENRAMRRTMDRYGEEDKEKALKKKRENEQSRLEVIMANDEQLRRKREDREAEKRDMDAMLKHQALEDARQMRRELEDAVSAKQKKDRQAKILAANEKSNSNADKADEIRARRAIEERERRERVKERDDYMRKRAETLDLVSSRQEQAKEKLLWAEHLKKQQEEEDRLTLRQLADMSEREEEERSKRQSASSQYKEMLVKQISDAEKRKKNSRLDTSEEGTAHRQELLREEARLCKVRDQMVSDLQYEGIDNRYLAEIQAVDIGKLLRH